MPVTVTPLRYPGGKTKLYQTILPYLQSASSEGLIYVEPFAGGAGLAFKLLLNNNVQYLILNDLDRNIYLFWKECIEKPDALCDLIKKAELTVDNWKSQKKIIDNSDNHTDLEIAFATLYLNRCNRSGILRGGPIGGLLQNGKYKIDARFNKEDLIRKIYTISQKRNNVQLYCLDAKDFLNDICSRLPVERTIINIDPPYVNKGPELYQNAFAKDDHVLLSRAIRTLKQKWIVTYDVDPLIMSLYADYNIKELELNYSAGSHRKVGHEYFITNIGIE